MLSELCVVGYPSRVGGADTELDHQIHVWQALGVKVHLIPTGMLDANLKSMRLEDRGCVIHEPGDWAKCRGRHVISYCNGEYLKHLEVIRSYAKSTTFVNCMCWLFDLEKECHQKGMIDCFLYQTDHARERVQKDLIAINANYRWFKVRPYFHAEDFPCVANRPEDKFRFGRVSREDSAKFHPSQLWVYESMVAPVLKEGVILGINDRIRDRIGKEPNWITGLPAGAIPVREVYQHAHCIIQMAETYENLPRVGFEAMASGCLLIVDNRGGWREEVLHGQTGFLCNNEREFVYYASRAAFERAERLQMVERAREYLVSNWGMEQAKLGWGEFFSFLETLSR
jgi:glycosyltransferase involved in cell wall biosynthesis